MPQWIQLAISAAVVMATVVAFGVTLRGDIREQKRAAEVQWSAHEEAHRAVEATEDRLIDMNLKSNETAIRAEEMTLCESRIREAIFNARRDARSGVGP